MEEGSHSKKIKLKVVHIVFAMVILGVIFILMYLIVSNTGPTVTVVKNGDNVSVFYTLSSINGTVIQSNFGAKPLSFVVGSGQMISGFNNAVIGMKVGQVKNVTLPPSEAYGNVNSSLIISVPITVFGNQTVSDGMAVTSSYGQRGVITAVNSTSVTVDFNPPLAGQTLVFEIKVASIQK